MARSVWIFERNTAAAHRIARIAAAACDMSAVEVAQSLADFGAASPDVVGLDASDLELVLERPWAERARFVVWTPEQSPRVLHQVRSLPSTSSLVAWPSILSTPRPWELSLAFRAAVNRGHIDTPQARHLIAPGGFVSDWRVATTTDRDETVEAINGYVERLLGSDRRAELISSVAYELLMNAMYDAPVDEEGRYLYAHDRRLELELQPEQAPTCRFATDGMLAVVEVVDPFGSIRRSHVLNGIMRGLEGRTAAADLDKVLDTSHGGAGLGIHRVFDAGLSVLFFVRPGAETRVMSVFDLNLSQRELRGMPGSVHFFGS